MSQRRNNSVRSEVIDKKWFTSIGYGSHTGVPQGVAPRTYGYNFIIKGKKWRGRKDHFLPHSLLDIRLPSSAPCSGWAGEFPVPVRSNRDCHGTMAIVSHILIQ